MILIWCVPTLLLTLLVSFPEKGNWNPSNFPWIYHDTTPIKGNLDKGDGRYGRKRSEQGDQSGNASI